MVVPHDTDVVALPFAFDAVLVSPGPGDPTKAITTINNVRKIAKRGIPMLGICLGNQIMSLTFGGDTYKLKFGHRSQNQPRPNSATSWYAPRNPSGSLARVARLARCAHPSSLNPKSRVRASSSTGPCAASTPGAGRAASSGGVDGATPVTSPILLVHLLRDPRPEPVAHALLHLVHGHLLHVQRLRNVLRRPPRQRGLQNLHALGVRRLTDHPQREPEVVVHPLALKRLLPLGRRRALQQWVAHPGEYGRRVGSLTPGPVRNRIPDAPEQIVPESPLAAVILKPPQPLNQAGEHLLNHILSVRVLQPPRPAEPQQHLAVRLIQLPPRGHVPVHPDAVQCAISIRLSLAATIASATPRIWPCTNIFRSIGSTRILCRKSE